MFILILKNKIPNDSNLLKKADYNTKISEIENKITADHDRDKYITIQEFNKSLSKKLTARIKQENLARKNDFANFLKKADFDNELKDQIKMN